MTLHVLRAVTRLNLQGVSKEVTAAHEERLISTERYEEILAAHVLLTTLIANACSGPPIPEDDPTVVLGGWE